MIIAFPLVTVLFLTFVWWIHSAGIGTRKANMPPGPPTAPVIGNIHQFPVEKTHFQFTEWAKQYGRIFSLKMLSETMIVITDCRLVRELLDKRNATTADRPPSAIGDMVTDGLHVALARYGPKWRALRRAIQSLITRDAQERHVVIVQAETSQLLHDLLEEPKLDILDQIRRTVASSVLAETYGIRSSRYENSAILKFHEVTEEFVDLLRPGKQPPIDIFPFLKYVPERWAPWKTKVNYVRHQQRSLYFGLRDHVHDRIQKGAPNGCFLETVYEQFEKLDLDEESVGYLGGVMMEGGADNTTTFLQNMVYFVASFPEVQAAAQRELDKVIGTRMPVFEDISQLPYVQAVIKEVERFCPPTPLAFPHTSTADEVIDGYLIPKGSVIFTNVYGMSRDETLFDSPDEFRPERFLNSQYGTKEEVDASHWRPNMIFGSGRRTCPGMTLANTSLAIVTMRFLWAFNIRREGGSGYNRDHFTTGFITSPTPFKCKITPRSQEHATVIRSEYADSKKYFATHCDEDTTITRFSYASSSSH